MKKIAYTVILLLAGMILFSGCSQPQTTPTTPVPAPAPATPTPMPDTVQVVANPQYGQILVDANGMTLYYFLRDTPGAGTSACTGACIGIWPVFNAATIQVTLPIQASAFGTINRTDGTKQTTYMGWPLYYYSGDKVPGDTNGYGFNKLWYVISPTGVVTLAPTTTIATTVPTTMPTTVPTTRYYGGGGY
jgi:predicted lipoprotein with Yx(FWY)xxD motif